MKYPWWTVWLLAVGLVVGSLVGCDDDNDKAETVVVVVTNAPADEEPECKKSDMVGTWKAAPEVSGTKTYKYSFALKADGSATYSTVTEDSGPPPTAMGAAGIGTWDLAGCNLILDNFGGGGVVSGNTVITGGRAFTKQ